MGQETVSELKQRILELELELAQCRQEKDLSARREALRFRTLFEHAPVSIWEEDFSLVGKWFAELRAQGVEDLETHLRDNPADVRRASEVVRIRGVNFAARQLLGLAPDADLSGSFCNIFKAETLAIFARELVGLWNGETQIVLEHHGRRQDGSRFDYILSMYVPEEDGYFDLSSVIVAISDITRLKQAEKLKEEVDRMARHDLKTPLSTVIGLSELLVAAQNVSESQRRYLGHIRDAGYRMLGMINLSLDMFKMEEGLYRLAPREVDLMQVLRRVEFELGSVARARKSRLAILLGGQPADAGTAFPVLGDELLCHSMLGNLIKNAFEATPEGEPVTVDLWHNGKANVRIHNQGAVPAEIRDRFFDKYVTCGKRGGTGLGTYSARLIAETQNGSISLETCESEGTAVTVVLPV